jgi:hypothetical protein
MTVSALVLVALTLGQPATQASAGTGARLFEAAKLGQAATVKELLAAGEMAPAEASRPCVS